jgi:Cu/Ag efflux pump CusA
MYCINCEILTQMAAEAIGGFFTSALLGKVSRNNFFKFVYN